MIKKRKAQGLSVSTIVIVVVALIVLVVLIALFTGRIGGFASGVEESAACETACKAFGGGATDADKAGCTDGTYLGGPGVFPEQTSGCCCAEESTCTATGGACTAGSECCSGTCTSSVCT